MRPHVQPLEEAPGLSLYDPVENARFVLYTDRPVEPRSTDPGEFAFPVETAVAIEAGELVVPKRDAIHVRTSDGRHVDQFEGGETGRFRADGDRLLDVSSTSMKLYLAVPGPFEIVSNSRERSTVISLPDPGEFLVGVRSFQERPAYTIETPADPEAVMRALSVTGSSLKTLSPERSYPTMRGHPPAFEPAEELSIPDAVEPPPTDVTIWVPPKWEFVYPAAPLVYYLGATLRAGGPPAIEVGDWSYPLGGPGVAPERFQRLVIRALQQVFFLDCLARTDGLCPVDLHERDALSDSLDVNLTALYDASLETRVRTFMDVSYETVEPHLPAWHLCVDVEPTADHVAALPYLLDDLALIRCRSTPEPAEPEPAVEGALNDFVRSENGSERAAIPGDVFTLEPAPAVEQAYLGDGVPLRRNKTSRATLQRRLEHDEPTADSIAVTIICNDETMTEETTVEDYYGVHDIVKYSIDVEYELTRAEFAEVLRNDVDLLHYIGHIDDGGFECSDGHFDAQTLDEVGVNTFLLNACNSYDQGQALLDGGARGGVTSLTVVSNEKASLFGRTMARALNAGFTLRSALTLTAIDSSTLDYVVLGDGGQQLVQCPSGVPLLIDVVAADLDLKRVSVDLFTFPNSSRGQGTLWSPSLIDESLSYLPFGHLDRFTTTIDGFMDYLTVQSFPVVADGTLYWSNEMEREQTIQLLGDIEELQTDDLAPKRVSDFLQPLRDEQ